MEQTTEGPHCPTHNRPIEYFCTDDQHEICSRCFIMGDHKEHSIISFEEKNKPIISSIENEIETATVVFNKLTKIDKGILKKRLMKEQMSVIEAIHHSFLQLVSSVRLREKQMVKEVRNIYDKCLSSFEGHIHDACNERKNLEKALLDAQALIQNQALVVDGEKILKTINAASQIPCIINESFICYTGWDETHIKDIQDAIDTFGSINTAKAGFDFLKTVADAPESILAEDKILRLPLISQKSVDTYSVSSVDTGEDVIIESDTDSVVSSTTARSGQSQGSSRSKLSSRDLVYPQIKGTLKQVTVTHIRTPNDFFIQLIANKTKLETLSRNINSWCRRKSSSHRVPSVVEKGMLVLACYSEDKKWYRAHVVGVELPDGDGDGGMKVHVIYYDFGNDEKLPLQNLRMMESRFEQHPPFCVQCSLHDIAPYHDTSNWDVNSVQEFFKMTNNQVLLLNVLTVKGILYEVDLICMPNEDVLDDKVSSVRDMLVFLELAKFAQPSQAGVMRESRIKTVNFYKPTALNPGDIVEMIVSEAYSPTDFYILPSGDEYLYYLNMMEEMDEVYENDTRGLYTMHCPRNGTVCVVKAPDGKWHRAKIVDEPKISQVTVFLTDTGSTLVVHRDQLRKLLSTFIKLPSQAIHCKLSDIGFSDSTMTDWSTDAKQWCQTDLKDSKGRVRVVRWGLQTEVVLWLGTKNASSVNTLLVEAGLATSTGLSSTCAQDVMPVVSKQLKPKENKSMKKISSPQSKSPKKPVSKNVSSPTISSSTPAIPKSKKSNKSEVPKKDKKQKSKQIKGSTNSDQNDELPESIADVEIARKKKVQEDIQRAVEDPSGESDKTPNQEEYIYIEIIVSHYNSPFEFFIRVKDKEDILETLMQEMDNEYKGSEAVEQRWKVDDFCVVKYPEDNRWYRAMIISTDSGDFVEVELLDYGNTLAIRVSELRPLVRDLGTRLHRAAVRCRLNNLIPTGSSDKTKWSRTAIDMMANVISRNKLYIKTEGDPSDDGLPIDIIVEEEIPETAFDPVTFTYYSLRQKLVDLGLAYLNKKRITESSSSVEKDSSSTEHKKILKPEVKEVPAYTVPDLNEEIEVIPTFIDFDGVVYVQRADWEDKITHLSHELQRVYQDAQESHRHWALGDLCVAYFPIDGLWYRGLIEEMQQDNVKIFYIDYGNSAWIKINQLCVLREPFGDYHVQVYHCVLEDLIPNTNDGAWPVAILDVMHEMIVNCQCTMVYTGSKENGHLKIRLQKSDDFDLSTYLLEREFVVSSMDLKEQFANSQIIGSILTKSDLCPSIDVGGQGAVLNAMATEIELPNIVYLQRLRMDDSNVTDFARASEIAAINSEIDDFDHMMAEIKTTPSSAFIKLPEVGTLCLGKFHFDQNWYRALCVKKYPEIDSCLLVFIDYGTSEIVSKEGLRGLPSQFWNLPCQGIRCYLNLQPPGNDDAVWKKNSLDAMVTALSQKLLVVKVIQSIPLTVELFVESEHGLSLAYEEVIQKGLARLPTQVDVNTLLGQGKTKQELNDVEVEDDDENNAEKEGVPVVKDQNVGSGVAAKEVCDANINCNNSVVVSNAVDGEKAEVSVELVPDGRDKSVVVPSVVNGKKINIDVELEVPNEDDDGDWTTDSDDVEHCTVIE